GFDSGQINVSSWNLGQKNDYAQSYTRRPGEDQFADKAVRLAECAHFGLWRRICGSWQRPPLHLQQKSPSPRPERWHLRKPPAEPLQDRYPPPPPNRIP